ncbi:MAG: sigma-54-dependent Fis family transcriptional regulator, partial [Proteobacteria bacterium]
INCGAITEELMESELFGHVKGSFTGANQTREGLFNYASGGTVFLDEIGEMPLSMQVHLLRVLEQKTIRQVGTNRETPVDVRVIAATNRDLRELVDDGGFREDLFYRLNVVSVLMPPLRERLEDLPLLVEHFANILASDMGLPTPEIRDAQIRDLASYGWPGNVRELKNVIERCLLLNKDPGNCLALSDATQNSMSDSGGKATVDGDRLDDLVRHHILRVLERENGNKSAAARALGVSRKTLERKVKEWQA